MKKLLLFLILMISVCTIAAADSRVNILANEPFFITTLDSGLNPIYSINDKWQGFTETADTYGENDFFIRKFKSPTYDDPQYTTQTFFDRPVEKNNRISQIFVSNLPSDPKCIFNTSITEGQKYEVGISLKTYNICFDPSLTRYGFTVKVEWYNNAEKLIATSIKNANIDSTLVFGSGENLFNEWIDFRETVRAPQGATYFKFYIMADKGVFTDFGTKIEIANPVFYICEEDPFNAVLNTPNVPMCNDLIYVGNGICNLNVSFKCGNNADFQKYLENGENKVDLSVKVYEPTKPKQLFDCPVTYVGKSVDTSNVLFIYNFNSGSLNVGNYVAEVSMRDKDNSDILLGTKKILFSVTDKTFNSGALYGPFGKDETGNIDQNKNYWLKDVTGQSIFMLGFVDRGVNFRYKKLDIYGLPYGINNDGPFGNGMDFVGSNIGTYDTHIPSTFADYLNPIASQTLGNEHNVFSYNIMENLGMNAVYPAYIARVPSFKSYGMMEALRLLGQSGCTYNIFFPLQEFSRNNYNRELQYRMFNERTVFSPDVYGSGNAYTQMAKAMKGVGRIVGYVLDDDLAVGDSEEIIDKRHQIKTLDNMRASCGFMDYNMIHLSAANPYLYSPEINEEADVLFINIMPLETYWTETEMNYLLNPDVANGVGYFLNGVKNFNKSIMINFALRKKEVAGGAVPLSISEMITIYNNFMKFANNSALSGKTISGIFFDDVAATTVVGEDANDVPAFHYNLFKLFLKERDKTDYQSDSDIIDESVKSYIYNNLKVNGNSLDEIFKEIHVKQIAENQYECLFYYNNMSDSVRNLNFVPNEYFRKAYSPVLYYTSSQNEFSSMENIGFDDSVLNFNYSVPGKTIAHFKLTLNYVPVPPVVTITPKSYLFIPIGETELLGYIVDGDSATDFVWSSETPEVATVDETGLVTGLANGVGTIKLSYKWNGNDYFVTKTVDVDNVVTFTCPDTVILDEINDASISGGRVVDVSDIHWSVSDDEIFELTSAPVLDHEIVQFKGIKAGKANVEVSYKFNGKTFTNSKEVTVLVPPTVKITPETDVEIGIAETAQLSYSVENGEITDLVWSSENPEIATVDNTGLVTGVSDGTAIIKLSYKWNGRDYNVTKNITVSDVPTVTITPEEETNIAGGPDNTSVQLGYKVSGGKEITDVEWSTNWYALKVDQTGLVTAKEGCAGVYTVTLSYKYNGEPNSVTKDIGAFVVAVRMPSFTSYFQTKKTLLVEYNSPMETMIRNGGVQILTPDTIVQSGTSGPYSIFVNIVGEGKEAAKFKFDLIDENGQFPGRHIDFKGLESYGEAQIEFTPTISPESLTANMGVMTPIEISITRGGLECEINSVTAEDTSVVTVYGTTLFKGIKVGDTNFNITYHPKNVDKEFTAKVPVSIIEDPRNKQVKVDITPTTEVNIAGLPGKTYQLGYNVSDGKEITDVRWTSSAPWALDVDNTGLLTAGEQTGIYTITLSYKYNGEEHSVTKDVGTFMISDIDFPKFTAIGQVGILGFQYVFPDSMIKNWNVEYLTPETYVWDSPAAGKTVHVKCTGEGKAALKITFDLSNKGGEYPERHINLENVEIYYEHNIEFDDD